MGIHAITRRSGLPGVLGIPHRSEGSWSSEMHTGADFLNAGTMGALDDLLLDLLGLLHGPGRSLLVVGSWCFLDGLLGHGLFALIVALGGCKEILISILKQK